MASTSADVWLFPACEDGVEDVPVEPITAPLHVEFSAAGHAFHEHWRSRVRIRSASHASAHDTEAADDAGCGEDDGHTDDHHDKLLEAAIESENLYGILGLGDEGCDATEEQIKKAYRKLLLKYHPDKKVGVADTKDTDAKFLQVQKAFDVLSDSEQRRGYDSQFDFDDDIPKGGEDFSEPQQFFDLYGPVFRRNARFSERRPVPQLGDLSTNMDDVLDFYNFWFKFQSWRDFSKYDEHDTSQAEFREEKRWMERQNASARAKRKAKEIKRVATLAERAYGVDPRVRAWKKEQKDSKRREREAREAAKKAEKEAARRQREEEEAKKAEKAKAAKAVRDTQKKAMKKLRKQLRNLCAEAIAAGAEVIHDEIIDYAAQSCNKEELLELCDKLRAAPGSLQPIEDRVDSLRTDEEREKIRRTQAARAAAKAAAEAAAAEAAAAFVPWTDAELSMLAKAIAKHPGGTKRRWKIISGMVSQLGINHRSADDCATKYKLLAKEAALARGKQGATEVAATPTAAAPAPEAATPPAAAPAPASAAAAPPATPAAASAPAPSASAAAAPAASETVWTPMQQEALEAALAKYPADMEKNARWNAIAAAVPGRTKKECVIRFKSLVAALKKRKADAAKTGKAAAPAAASAPAPAPAAASSGSGDKADKKKKKKKDKKKKKASA